MFDRTGREAIGRLGRGSRSRPRAGGRVGVEPLEGRALLTASIQPIAAVTVPQFLGYQLPVIGGTSDAQTYTVTSDTPGVVATVAQGKFLTIGVSHAPASGNASDPTINGQMTFQLFDDLTPNTTKMIEGLVNGTIPAAQLSTAAASAAGTDYYVGKLFQRVANGFPTSSDYIVQGGALNTDGSGSVFASPFNDEFVQQLAFTGTGQLAMANSGSDTNDSQFFVTTGSPRFLDHHHTIFGQIVSGQDVLQQLTQVAKNSDGQTPTSPITITSASLSSVSPDGVIHIDTSVAPVGTANLTITATDVVNHTTATQTVPVTVQPLSSTAQERPFLGPVDSAQTVAEGQTDTFQLTAVSPQPGAQLTYTVQGGTSSSTTNGVATTTFTSVQNATASVSANGLVTVTPTAGFSGTISLLVGVRDQVNRDTTSGSTVSDPSNYDTQAITLTVNPSTTPVAIKPIATPAAVTAVNNTTTPITLIGSNPNTTETTPIAYTLLTQPTHGTISGFNASTGTLNYTPTVGYVGPDAFQYVTNDPTSGLVSLPATVNLTVNQASTGAVRFIADDGSSSTSESGNLVVTPLPRTDGGTNTIAVTQSSDGNVNVTVNGVLDAIQPAVGNVDSVIVYGSKANDKVTVNPSLTVPVTLDGGHGGKNVLVGGGGPTREHGWFGKNTLTEGSDQNFLLGAKGHVKFVKGSGTSDVLYTGNFSHLAGTENVRRALTPTTGTFYTFKGNKLEPTESPYTPAKTTGNAPKGPTTTTTTHTKSHGGNGNSSTVKITKIQKQADAATTSSAVVKADPAK